jgi:hypothetical protein
MACGPRRIDHFVQWALFGLVLHGRFTIPIALVATWAFVKWVTPRGCA